MTTTHENPTSELRKVERASARVATAELALDDAITAASDAGASLRAIGRSAGLSHEEIRRRLARRTR